MFYLVAESAHPRFNGEVARRPFETLEAAETLMRTWARFGVENLCDEADRICVYDADGHVQSVWSRRQRAPVRMTGETPLAQARGTSAGSADT